MREKKTENNKYGQENKYEELEKRLERAKKEVENYELEITKSWSFRNQVLLNED